MKQTKINSKNPDKAAPVLKYNNIPISKSEPLLIPLHFELYRDAFNGMPTPIRNTNYSSAYNVEEGIYTIRAGIISGQDCLNEYSAITCSIPALSNDEQCINYLFVTQGIHPAQCEGTICLKAKRRFLVKLIYGSTVLENSNNISLPLINPNFYPDYRTLTLHYDKIYELLPCCYKYFFHALRTKVAIEFVE